MNCIICWQDYKVLTVNDKESKSKCKCTKVQSVCVSCSRRLKNQLKMICPICRMPDKTFRLSFSYFYQMSTSKCILDEILYIHENISRKLLNGTGFPGYTSSNTSNPLWLYLMYLKIIAFINYWLAFSLFFIMIPLPVLLILGVLEHQIRFYFLFWL